MYWNEKYQSSTWGLTGLTLTWDVLKFLGYKYNIITKFWLTLTWDVLKLNSDSDLSECFKD